MAFWEILLLVSILFFAGTFLVMSLGMMFGASFGAPFVPSGSRTVAKMIEEADLKKGEKVFDLGCGDGRLVFAAAKKGAIAIGIEISPPVFLLARFRQFLCSLKTTEIRFGNIFSQKDLGEADVIFAFLLPPLMNKIFSEIWPKLKPGARIVSHAFSPSDKTIRPKKILPREKNHGKILVFEKS